MKLAALLIVLGCGGPPPSAPPAAPTPISARVAPPPDAPLAAVATCDPTAPECACEHGDAAACSELAAVEFQRGDRDLAIITAYGACQKDDVDGCLAAAVYLDKVHVAARLGTTPAQLRERAITLLEQRCTADDPAACFELGKHVLRGKIAPVDPKRGVALVDRACTLGEARGCLTLASTLDPRKDAARISGLYSRACTLGAMTGCTLYGDSLHDRALAATICERACTGDDAAGCARTGHLLDKAGDHAHALERFRRACELEDGGSCADAAKLLVAANDPTTARTLYRIACERDLGPACAALGGLIGSGAGGDRDWSAAVALHDKACTLQVPASCAEAKRLRRTPPDGHCATKEQCEQLCTEQIGKSCTQLGKLAATAGECTAAISAFTTGCDRGDGEGCRLLGNHDAQDTDALEVYRRACAAKDADGCMLADFVRWQEADHDSAAQKQAVKALERDCAARPSACVWYGNAAQPDPRATMLLGSACDHQDGRACRSLALVVELDAFRDDDEDREDQAVEQRHEHDRQAKIRGLLRKGCTLGDLLACNELESATGVTPVEVEAVRARVVELLRARPCAPDDVVWERP